MAITKIHAIKSTLGKALAYIENPDKTDGQMLVSGYNCEPQTASIDFEMTAVLAHKARNLKRKRSTNLAYHLIQSFSPEDAVTPEQAHELGKKLAFEYTGGKYEYVVATHIDKGHIHNHIMINAVSFYDYDWRQNHYVSLGGLNYVALDNYLENHPEIHKLIYKPLIKSGYKIACPTLTDLYNDLKEQPHERAHEIALALELFATGSMNMFAHPTNVDMSNRLICFNIQSLGDQLKPVAMLSMLEYINTCVMSNERNDPKAATWVYFDEIYLLLRDKLSSQFLYTSWKRFRKYNAYATGITQNVQDCLSNDTAYAMLANSEFVCMLRQTKDIDSVVELYGLSDPQKNYLKLAKPGQGILKMGNNLIPFVNDHPTNTKIYRLLTTKPGEMEN